MSCLTAVTAGAQDVALSGMLGNKPLLVVNGSTPRAVAVGETHMGVKVLGAGADRATVLSGGQRFTIRLGESPVHIGGVPLSAGNDEEGASDGRRIVLTQTGGGHFVTNGTINGKAVQFVVDTGATFVAMGVADAERLGLAYKKGARLPMQTANGVNVGWGVTLDSVRLKGVQVHGVDAVVINANYAIDAGLDPVKDPIAVESGENNPYANIITVHRGDEKKKDIVALVDVLHSKEIQDWIRTKYKGAVIPVNN